MKSCLVVDDSKVIRTVARRILQALEFDTREAQHGEEALERCAEAMPDAILLDWNMPVMDGLTFLKQLRQSRGGDAPVVVFCTTMNELSHIRQALEAGANEYIMKPFDKDMIEQKFQQTGLLG